MEKEERTTLLKKQLRMRRNGQCPMPKLGTIFQDIYHQNLGMNRYIRVTLHSLSDTHDTPSNANK